MISPVTNISRGISGARWQLSNCDEEALARLRLETGEDEVLLRCLLNRGLSKADKIREFLDPQFGRHLHSPLLLRDMERAVERLRRAVSKSERILIVTDFDVDGTTSSVIISQTLK